VRELLWLCAIGVDCPGISYASFAFCFRVVEYVVSSWQHIAEIGPVPLYAHTINEKDNVTAL
jgi:hypothetical protein